MLYSYASCCIMDTCIPFLSLSCFYLAFLCVTSLSLFTFMHWRRKWQPTPVFLPGESQGRGNWWTAICGVAQSRTRLKRLSSSSSSSCSVSSQVFFRKNGSICRCSFSVSRGEGELKVFLHHYLGSLFLQSLRRQIINVFLIS